MKSPTVCIRLELKNRGPHVAVIDAFRTDGTQILRVLDPAEKTPVEVSYSALRGGTYGSVAGLWSHTYFITRI